MHNEFKVLSPSASSPRPPAPHRGYSERRENRGRSERPRSIFVSLPFSLRLSQRLAAGVTRRICPSRASVTR